MAAKKFSRTWWGQRFIEALEAFTEENRLGRGRSYARNGKILNFQISKGLITAKVRGSINPYFGVYKEPTYNTKINIKQISSADWTKLIKSISSKAGFVSQLLMNEIPDNIETIFRAFNLNLLPHSRSDLDTKCSCPDYANPCKHIAGVYYLVASELDKNPFFMFEMRGLPKDKLHQELKKSPLGEILSSQLEETAEVPLKSTDSFYTKPVKEAITKESELSCKEFWTGKKKPPASLEKQPNQSGVSAILIKKQGDYPPFWPKDNSFIEVFEELYQRVKLKNNKMLG